MASATETLKVATSGEPKRAVSHRHRFLGKYRQLQFKDWKRDCPVVPTRSICSCRDHVVHQHQTSSSKVTIVSSMSLV
jgi:hypothetical protein